jgi:nicotinate-nucleotide adenylyltransferase
VRRAGILGGTFNPPHLGHLAVARRARAQLGLDRVLLIPAHMAAHKPAAEDPGPEHRLRMCGLLVEDAGGLSACALEIERGGRTYTVDTLQAIHASHPDAELTLIVGADTACTLPAWREPAKLLELADLAVAARAGTGRREVLDTLLRLTGASGGAPRAAKPAGLFFLDTPVIEISSSMARGLAARGEEIDELVGGAVARYIAERGLYRPRARAAS